MGCGEDLTHVSHIRRSHPAPFRKGIDLEAQMGHVLPNQVVQWRIQRHRIVRIHPLAELHLRAGRQACGPRAVLHLLLQLRQERLFDRPNDEPSRRGLRHNVGCGPPVRDDSVDPHILRQMLPERVDVVERADDRVQRVDALLGNDRGMRGPALEGHIHLRHRK